MIAQRYEVGEKIGEGGMGTVYRAIDRHSGQPVAIKRLRAESANPALIARFLREADALRQLNHPNIVKLFDAIEEDGQNYLVMEYVSGGSLADLLRREGQLPLEKILPLALDLADALTRTHRLNILHRDVKPANVLIAEDGTPRLTDFGLAHFSDLSPITDSGSFTGTYSYASPEACQNRDLDARTDIWSFGVMLFEMLAGRRPFEAQNPLALVTAILSQPTPDLTQLCPDVPAALVDLVNRMLVKNPSERIPSVRAVALELEALQKGFALPMPAGSALEVSDLATHTPAPKYTLPIRPTVFIGRQNDLTALEVQLREADCRLLTIVGAGGMGKTRLALELAHRVAADFERGVCWVELAALSTPDAIVTAIATALGLQIFQREEMAGSNTNHESHTRQLLAYLRHRNLLLVLDNCEHLLDGLTLLNEFLTTAPQVKILTTSREPLNLGWEWLYQLEGMSVPQNDQNIEQFAAVQLFTERARRVKHNFDPAQERSHVVRICQLVDGMPLGIEMSAAWVKRLPCERIADDIAHNFDLLTSAVRDVPQRHRSMRAVFDYSWNLLSDTEQNVLMKVSVFQGGFTFDAAHQIADATRTILAGLVDKSLLRVDATERYDLHELLRQYTAEKLALADSQDAVRDAHCVYFMEFIARLGEALKGHRGLNAHLEIELDFENIRTAWEWAVQQNKWLEIGRGVEGFSWFCLRSQRRKIRAEALGMVLTRWPDPPSGDAAVIWAGVLARYTITLDNFDEQKRLLEKSLAILRQAGAEAETALPLRTLARLARIQHDELTARRLLEEALMITRKHGNQWESAWVLSDLGWLGLETGNLDLAQRCSRECLVLIRGLGDRQGIARSHLQLAAIALALRDYESNEQFNQKALAGFREIGDHRRVADTLSDRSWAAYTRGEFARASQLIDQSLALYQEQAPTWQMGGAYGILGFVCHALGRYHESCLAYRESLHVFREYPPLAAGYLINIVLGCAMLFASQGRLEQALELLGVALTSPVYYATRPYGEALLKELRAELAPDFFEQAWQRSQTLKLDDVLKALLVELSAEDEAE